MNSGWQNLSGMAAVGAKTSGALPVPSWLVWLFVLLVGAAALSLILGLLARFLRNWEESRRAARIEQNHREAVEEGRRAREARGEPPL